MTSILNSVTVLTYLKSSVMMTFTDANNVRNVFEVRTKEFWKMRNICTRKFTH
ncbi:Uncharacterized protein BM_BM1305 [Brugia malayi]|uniref:Bm1305 n=1 Tax=Brugia malayi TaxID=6279 RepID=A0A0K0IWQ0_BRUMA|nr:Uncharacterized protein BM_BM1305 [Brugia malayi]CRZ24163.1 Bm1305 [Brugia malayi]VIO94585.1 Uncharacterized protein BM_BM1305 [Brugia malayi]